MLLEDREFTERCKIGKVDDKIASRAAESSLRDFDLLHFEDTC